MLLLFVLCCRVLSWVQRREERIGYETVCYVVLRAGNCVLCCVAGRDIMWCVVLREENYVLCCVAGRELCVVSCCVAGRELCVMLSCGLVSLCYVVLQVKSRMVYCPASMKLFFTLCCRQGTVCYDLMCCAGLEYVVCNGD